MNSAREKPALVLLHGFALDSRMWRRQIEAFREEFRLLTLDLPGFGPQAREMGEVDPAAEVGKAMDIVGLPRAHFVTSSYGAAVAIDYALRYVNRVESLTLTGPLLLGRRMGIESWGRCVTLANDGDRATAAEIWLDDPMFETLRRDEALFEEVRQIVLDYGGAHWTGKVLSKWSDPDPVPRLRQIDVPSLVVSGESDIPSFMLMAEAYARGLPKAQREIVPGVGHLVNVEAADSFNQIYRSFLKTAGVA
jgi:pimeloyl-ACP methyl ester carboxylesterase